MSKINIEVGEYVRTRQGDISKVEYVDEESIFLKDSVWSKNDLYEKTGVLYFDDEEIVMHSKNIIDLIEVRRYSKNWSRYNFFKCFRNPRRFRLF